MAFDRNEIDGPKNLFDLNRQEVTGQLEKASAPNLKQSFNTMAYGSTPIDARMAQSMGMQQVINPIEPIETPDLKDQQAMQMNLDDMGARAQMTSMSLQEMRPGLQSGPKSDSIFSAVDTMSNEVRGIGQSLNGGPDMATMDPRLQMQMNMAMMGPKASFF